MKKGISIAEFVLGIVVTICGAAITTLSLIQMRSSK